MPHEEADGGLGEGEHDDERGVGMLGSEVLLVGGVGGEGDVTAGVAGGGLGDAGGWSAVEPAEVALAEFGFFGDVDFDNLDGLGGAGLHAGGCFAFREAVVAHVALADDAALLRIL